MFIRFLFQAVVVYYLRSVRIVSIGRVLCAAVYVESFPEHEFSRDFHSSITVQFVDHHVWIYAHAVFRQS